MVYVWWIVFKKYYEYQTINDKDEIKLICNKYINEYYDINDTKDEWFNKLKELASSLGYADEVKKYKENPDNYKGSVADVSTVIRVSLTSSSMTPDLYEIMKLLGVDRMKKRIDLIK